ncbi:MAG: ATP-binding protein, partial [Actinomycetota bacterium]|nr:ATP-binding protein [Actinomycetota bacterium]
TRPGSREPAATRRGGRAQQEGAAFMNGWASTRTPSNDGRCRPACHGGTVAVADTAAAACAQPLSQNGDPQVPPARHSGAGRWPMRHFLELGALSGAVPCARLHARHVLREWGLAAVADVVELVVAELLTNAISASRAADPDSPVRLWLQSDRASVLVQVWDASPQPPSATTAGADDEHGRGLLLVEAVSVGCGWYIPAANTGTAGKAVWALCQPNGE